jgi:beta-lactamase class D
MAERLGPVARAVHHSVAVAGLLLAGCGTAPPPVPHVPDPPPPVHRFDAGEELLAAEGLDGTFICRMTGAEAFLAAFPALIDEPFIPASTFKVPHTLIGLETGVIPDERFTLAWDGVGRSREEWNRDHDLASAMAESVVWYYQEVAHRIGPERMADWLRRLDYGNADMGSTVDAFWLAGPLRITPRQQVEFLERLTSGRLPVAQRNVGVLERVMPSREFDGRTIRAKTGTYVGEEGCHAWLVGWAGRGESIGVRFALLLRCTPASVPDPDRRWKLAARLIEATGAISD